MNVQKIKALFNNNFVSAPLTDEIIKAIEKHKIHSIEVNFDGCGDSGQIEDIQANGLNQEEDLDLDLYSISLGNTNRIMGYQYDKDGNPSPITQNITANLGTIIEEICYDLLEKRHGGWEINEGSYGTFTFDFSEGKIKLNYNERITDVEVTDSVIDFSKYSE